MDHILYYRNTLLAVNLHPSNMFQRVVSCISKQSNSELGTSKITIYYYSSPWEMICFGLMKAEHCLPLPSFIKQLYVKKTKPADWWESIGLLQLKGRTIITELRENMCRNVRAKSYCNSSTKKKEKRQKKREKQVQGRTSKSKLELETKCTNFSVAMFWSVTQQNKGFCLHLEIESILHRKWQKICCLECDRSSICFHGDVPQKVPSFIETVNHDPVPHELMRTG